jgi:hypothetical protein
MAVHRSFWIVGGEYTDMHFDEIVAGTEKVVGPLASRELAERTWRQLSERHRPQAMVRFSILVETSRNQHGTKSH